jgi:hypothetical protein
MNKLNIDDLRATVKTLTGKNIEPINHKSSRVWLENGVVYFEGKITGAMHPKSFLDLYGADVLRGLDKDVSDEQLEKFISE